MKVQVPRQGVGSSVLSHACAVMVNRGIIEAAAAAAADVNKKQSLASLYIIYQRLLGIGTYRRSIIVC